MSEIMGQKNERNNLNKKLYVTNIHYDAQDSDLRELFLDYGTVVSAKIVHDRETGDSRGFGFVEMSSPEEAERAIAADGERIMGREVKVCYARAKGGA